MTSTQSPVRHARREVERIDQEQAARLSRQAVRAPEPSRDQLRALARPFPPAQVQRKPGKGGGDYVEHNTVTERLLWNVGPFDQHVTQVIRDGGDGGPVVAVVLRLTVTVDGRPTTIEECGEVEHPDNWAHDGQRLKVAVSDGIKRCAMRLGLGLHLWSQGAYFLPAALDQEQTG